MPARKRNTGLMPNEVTALNAETQKEARKMLERVAKLPDEIEKMKRDERQQWIPVTEMFPEPETYILVSLIIIYSRILRPIELMMTVAEHFTGGDEDYTYLSVGLYVNAWMPLPEPYKEENY